MGAQKNDAEDTSQLPNGFRFVWGSHFGCSVKKCQDEIRLHGLVEVEEEIKRLLINEGLI